MGDAARLPEGYLIRLATPDDLPAWHHNLALRLLEDGVGQPRSMPRSAREPFDRSPEVLARQASRLPLPVGVPEWRRIWLVCESASGAIVGDGDLKGAALTAEAHRCWLGIGFLRAHQRRGLGTALLASMIEWARAQPELHWIDLGVFAGNTHAARLYARFGFRECGRHVDRFRVEGESIDDIMMSLALRG